MRIYIYERDSKIVSVDKTGKCFDEAWDDFQKVYNWGDIWPEAEEENDAFIRFCEDVSNCVFESEFEIIEWDLE